MESYVLEDLYKPFDVHTKPGQGFRYIKSSDVVDRMNRTFSGNWNTKVIKNEIMEDIVVIQVEVTVYPVEDNPAVCYTHTGFGSSAIKRYSSGPNEGKIIDLGSVYKAAQSLAIRNACSKWGVGLNLEEEDGTEPRASSTKSNTSNIPKPDPGRPVTEEVKAKTNIPMPKEKTVSSSVSFNPKPNEELPKPVNPFPTPKTETPVKKEAVKAPSFPSGPSSPPQKTNNAPVETKNDTPFPKIPMPKEVSATQATNKSDSDMISDVQKAALNGLLTIRGLEYNKLVKDAFDSKGLTLDSEVPDPDDLTYKQAVAVIRYGNDLFKKKN